MKVRAQAPAAARLHLLRWGLVLGLLLPATGAWAQAALATLNATDASGAAAGGKRQAKPLPISGEVRMDTWLGAGSLVGGESNRTTLDLQLGYRLAYAAPKGLTLSMSQVATKNAITSVDAGAVRPNDTLFGDLVLAAAWAPRVRGDDGKDKRLTLPLGIAPSFVFSYAVPNSRSSQFFGRLGATSLGVNFAKPGLFGKLSLVYGVAATKILLTRNHPAVSAEDFPTLARPGGAELLNGEIMTGASSTSYSFRQSFVASWQFNDRWSFALTYLQSKRYLTVCPPLDQYASIYATDRCGSDSQAGFLSLNYALDAEGQWAATAMVSTGSSPRTADTHSFRFPFFDFRSTADNLSSVGLEVSRSF